MMATKNFNKDPEIFYIEKTGHWSSHSIIYNWLSNFQPGTKVLEIGAATGILGKKCQGFGYYLKGIEPVVEWAQMAKDYYDEFLFANLEEAPDRFLEQQDVVICADILEHTSTPKQLLKHLADLQKPETQFLISVPNIAFILIRFNLLIGKFNYEDYGILDQTHLRFFTKYTFLEMLKSSGLRPIEIRYTPPPLSRVNLFYQKNPIGRLVQRLFAALATLLPSLFAYQFVVRSKQITEKGDYETKGL